jgi:hypothetical protein
MKKTFITKNGYKLTIGKGYSLFMTFGGGGYISGFVHEDGTVFGNGEKWASGMLGEAYAEYLNKNNDAFQANLDRTSRWWQEMVNRGLI